MMVPGAVVAEDDGTGAGGGDGGIKEGGEEGE